MGAGLFGAIINGFIAYGQAKKQEQHIRLGLEMLLSFWLSMFGSWSAVGLTVYQQTGSSLAALTIGFLTGLGVGAGAAYVRFTNSQYSKELGLTVTGEVTKAAETTLTNGGVDLQKGK